MGEPVKGTVTSLSSVFAPEDAQKASVRVQEVISERQKEVQQLQGFLNENTSLVNLVKKLPDQLHHDIMVPFGKAAFFPGRLIHTNEFMVLLGEGYYAERTSKQTVEILRRRGKNLESQIGTLNGIIKDLKFEASFFDETATEAAEGIVEIREDYVDEASNEDKTTPAGDDDFARILSRIDELEKEEESEMIAEEKEESEMIAEEREESEMVAEEKEESDISQLIRSMTVEPEAKNSEQPKHSLEVPLVSKDSHVKVPTPPSESNPPLVRLVEHNDKLKESLPRRPVSSNEVSNYGSSSSNDRSKAFTGSIVEHTHNIDNNQKGPTPAPASKPISRFKLQRK